MVIHRHRRRPRSNKQGDRAMKLTFAGQIGLFTAFAMSLAGCSSVGPVVTDVTKSGENTLTIEKCYVTVSLVGYSSVEDCRKSSFKVQQ